MRPTVLVLALAPFLVAIPAFAQWATPRGEVIFPDQTRVRVEIARSDDERARGLMFRDFLGSDEGMIFIFEERGIYPFWMKNTLIPLDMLWLDERGRVTALMHSVPPCKADPCPNYIPDAEAIYVLEVNGGFAKRHGVKVGDTLVLRNIPRPLAAFR